VELLVVIAVIGILVALLMPAIQSARESARRVHCQNNVKQIGAALFSYHDAFKTFPHGGWGHGWVGAPERGAGRRQPGGWIYALLPFAEEQDLHDLGFALSGADADRAYSLRLQSSICLLVCSSRRPCTTWPVSNKYPYARTPKPYGTVADVARSDYAINGGSSVLITHAGPMDFNLGDDESYWRTASSNRKYTGVSHLRTAASLRQITDGASKTYLVGEKYIESAHYDTGESAGDNESQYAGYCSDLHRFAGALERLTVSQSPLAPPISDSAASSSGVSPPFRFGSAHVDGLNMQTCDGAVHYVDFDIEPDVHLRFGHRNDGGAAIDALFRPD
jgi:type II secretory pathway pseudopilin PulG